MRAMAPYMNIGWSFVVAIGLGILAGRWLDAHFKTEPWLFIAGALLGIAVGFYQFFLVVLRK
jgi:F0F1-type ATP synthase assembly protein I